MLNSSNYRMTVKGPMSKKNGKVVRSKKQENKRKPRRSEGVIEYYQRHREENLAYIAKALNSNVTYVGEVLRKLSIDDVLRLATLINQKDKQK